MFRSGLDILVEEKFARVDGQRVALLANPAAVDAGYIHLLDRALQMRVNLVRLFGPEHGLLGDAQDMADVAGHLDRRTGLPVVSLYGKTHDSLFLQPEDLAGVDVLICDLQDIGSRYYTFSYTIAFAMRACAKTNTRCIVLDRPNPIGANRIAGNLVKDGFRSFVGEYALPNQHGFTLGELCNYFVLVDDECRGCPLEVVWMEDYRREDFHEETGATWVMPSPNMPTIDTAIVYPGGCLIEGTNLSEGRGTTRPFELIGAPYIQDAHAFADAIGDVSGAFLRPCFFTPTFQKHAGRLCGGVQVHVADRARFCAFQAFVQLIVAAQKLEGFAWRRDVYEFVDDQLAIDLLFGDDAPRSMIERGANADDVVRYLQEDLPAYEKIRHQCLHYRAAQG